MQTNTLSDSRPRVLSIAGTSPVHQMIRAEQVRLVDITTRAMGEEGVYVAGVLPNPLSDAKDLIGELAGLQRPPDAYLIMPLAGVYDPDGMYNEFMAFGEEMDDRFGARLIYYFKDSRDLSQMGRLFRDSEAFVGVKVGTGEADVEPLVRAHRRQRPRHLGHRRPLHPRLPARRQRATPPASPSPIPKPPTPLTMPSALATMPSPSA